MINDSANKSLENPTRKNRARLSSGVRHQELKQIKSMNTSLDAVFHKDSKRDIWIFLLISLLVYVFFPPAIAYLLKPHFPNLSFRFFGNIGVILSLLVPIIYFAIRYVPIDPLDYFPKITHLPILFIGVVVVFLFIALSQISGGWRNETMSEISKVGGFQAYFSFGVSVLIGPVLEETFWRKYVLQIFRDSYPIIIAVLLTVILETIFHFGYFKNGVKPVITIFICLLLYSIIYLKSNLGVSITVHCIFNFMVLTLSGYA